MQRPVPRGGGILPYTGWELWHKAIAMKYGRTEGQFPDMEFTLGSVDCAFGLKQESDYTAMVVLGVWKNLSDQSRVMLMFAWQKRLKFADAVEEISKCAKKYKIDRILIENKGSGISIFQEMARLTREERFALQLVDPGRDDKEQRANAVSHLFGEEHEDGVTPRREGLIYAPAITQPDGQVWPRDWAEKSMAECVAGETLIVCAEGVVPAADVRPGMSVLTHKGRFRPVMATSCREAEKTVTLTPKSLEPLTLTTEHPVFAAWISAERRFRAPDWVAAGAVETRRYQMNKRGDERIKEAVPSAAHATLLPVVQREEPIDEIDLMAFCQLPGRDFGIAENWSGFVATSHPKSRVFQRGQKLDYEFGWVMGLYLAEGSASRRFIQWSLNAKKEVDLAKRVATFCSQRLNLEPRVIVKGPVLSVDLSAAMIAPFFTACGPYAGEKRIPDWMWEAPDEFLSGVLHGWADGDGCLDRCERTVVTTISPSLAIGMRLIALRLGIPAVATLSRDAGWTVIGGRRCRTRPAWKVTWRNNMTNRGATLFMPQIDDLPRYAAFSLMGSEPGPEGIEVYNFDVLEDHSYCTAGGLVHNCASFPKGRHDDLADALVQGLGYLRKRGLIKRPVEHTIEEIHALLEPSKSGLPPLYPG
jgi:phage terminase large subunit-like protein